MTDDQPDDLKILADLRSQTTGARALDLFATEYIGLSARVWARRTDRKPDNVRSNAANGLVDVDEIPGDE